MLKTKIISDTHNLQAQLSIGSGDLLVHCGDVGTKGNLTEAMDFLYWFNRQPYKYKVVVAGNHDKKLKEHPDAIRLAQDLGIYLLRDDTITIEGKKIHGVDTVFKSYDWYSFRGEICGMIDGSDEARTKAWSNIPEGLDLLITHSPPYGIADFCARDKHIGCKELLQAVKDKRPRYHAFGHCHEGRGKEIKAYDTTFINAAVLDEHYRMVYYGGYNIEL